jgi:hypothetical protein
LHFLVAWLDNLVHVSVDAHLSSPARRNPMTPNGTHSYDMSHVEALTYRFADKPDVTVEMPATVAVAETGVHRGRCRCWRDRAGRLATDYGLPAARLQAFRGLVAIRRPDSTVAQEVEHAAAFLTFSLLDGVLPWLPTLMVRSGHFSDSERQRCSQVRRHDRQPRRRQFVGADNARPLAFAGIAVKAEESADSIEK